MGIELDHVFVCTAPGAPEARELSQFGLREGPPNQHPGQGTACRRFAFKNAMLELLWVTDKEEATSEQTRRTLLWERWTGRSTTTCPFGICLRPCDSPTEQPLFDGWEYRPSYLPGPLAMHIGEAGLDEPMWVYLSFLSRKQREQQFVEHRVGIREITGLLLTCPVTPHSTVFQVVMDAKCLAVCSGPTPLLEIEFDLGKRQKIEDFRPLLPLIFRY
jgi:hypothetical protein